MILWKHKKRGPMWLRSANGAPEARLSNIPTDQRASLTDRVAILFVATNRFGVESIMQTLEQVITDLKAKGYKVERCDFPGPPFPGLYIVNGPDVWGVELTEAQLVSLLRQAR